MKGRSEVKHGSRREPERNAQDIPVAPGLVAKSPVRFSVEDVNGYDVVLDVDAVPMSAARSGRFVCRQLTVSQREGGPPVTSEAVRSIPVARLTKEAGARHVWSFDSSEGGINILSKRALTDEMVQRFKATGPTDESLWWVAYVYRLALVAGEPPTKTVEQALELPRSTTGRWIAAARQRNFLGDSEGAGKAGG